MLIASGQGDIQIFADLLGGKIENLAMTGDNGTFLRGAIYIHGVASAFAQEFATMAIEVFN